MSQIPLAGCVATLFIVGSASAQNALGAGDVLDANTRTDSNGRNSVVNNQDYRARNLIVTGNVAGGGEFRGSVGYSADRDFRGATGSDEFYRFRAGSAYSSGAAVLSGASLSRFNTGYDPVTEYRRASTGRVIDDPRWNVDQARYRESAEVQSGLIPPSRRRFNDSQMVGLVQSADGNLLSYSASSVRGIEENEIDRDSSLMGLSYYDRIRLNQDAEKRVSGPKPGAAFDPRVNTRVDSTKVEGDAAQPLLSDRETENAQPLTPYQELVDRLARQAKEREEPEGLPETPASDDRFNSDLDALRRELLGIKDEPLDPADTVNPDHPDATKPPKGSTPESNANQGNADEKPERSIDEFAGVVRHGGELLRLTASEENRLNELLAGGEKSLRDARYFDAEERFERALRITPNHPLATLGLVNAELGAGVYRSASLALRSLYLGHPELIDVQIDRALLPKQDRLDAALTAMRDRLERTGETDAGSVSSDVQVLGLLMAYTGRQLNDKALIAEGLGHFEKSKLDPKLAALLRSVWLSEAAPVVTMPAKPPVEEPSK